MLYNEKQKMRYLEQSDMVDSAKEFFCVVARSASKVEIQESTDLCNFNRKQVINLLKSYNSKARSYIRLICSHFSRYKYWCIKEGLANEDSYVDWYDTNLSGAIVKEIVTSEMIMDKFFDQDTAFEYVEKIKDNSNKLAFYAPYIGIDGVEHEDIRYLRISDLDEEKKVISLHSGRIAKVDELFIKLIKAANSDTRYNKNGDGAIAKRDLNYYNSEYVFKVVGETRENIVMSSKSLVQRYRVVKEQTGNKLLNISLVYKNGLFNYLNNHFLKKGITLRDALFSEVIGSRGRVGSKYTHDEELEMALRDYGVTITTRFLRLQLEDVIQFWND